MKIAQLAELKATLAESVEIQAQVVEHLRQAREHLLLATKASQSQESLWAKLQRLEERAGWDDSMVDPISDLAPLLDDFDVAWETVGEPIQKPVNVTKSIKRIWSAVVNGNE